MKKDLTELVFIMDESGSMGGLEKETVGGFNSLIEKQKEVKGECLVSTVFFSNNSRVIHDRVNLKDIKKMKLNEYVPSGCTALIDALGGAIKHISNVHKYIREEDVPEKTMFIITTDGLENASNKYDSKQVKEMVKEKKDKGWEFIYLAANIDAIETAKDYGIDSNRAVNFVNDSKGTRIRNESIEKAVKSYRINASVCEDWSKEANDDYKKRG